MKNYLELSSRTIKVQKKRAILTVIGIILSVALITGLGTLITSWQDSLVRGYVEDYGDYYTAFTGVSGDSAQKVVHHVSVEKSCVSTNEGYAVIADNSKEKGQPPHQYLNIKAVTPDTYNILTINLKDGRFPTKPGEIVLDYWALKSLPQGTKIGDSITLEIGDRLAPNGTALKETYWDENETFKGKVTQTYTLVGLVKPKAITDRNFANAIVYLDGSRLSDATTYDVFAKLKTAKNVQTNSETIAKDAGIVVSKEKGTEIIYNEHVLRFLGESTNAMLNSSMKTILAIIVLLIVVATVAVIYNAFNMSVVEKVSMYGLLRCIGSTPRQVRNTVYREAYTLAAVGVPIGVLCGTLAMGILFEVIKGIAPSAEFMHLNLVISLPILLGSIVLGIITVFLSAYLPARRAAKVSPMEAVRNTGEFKKEKFKRISRSRLFYKLLGVEGWVAWKNIGRNRKRFYITVFSMVISIVLFIAFGSMVDFGYQAGVIDQSSYPSFALRNKSIGKMTNISAKDESDIKAIPGIQATYRYGAANASVVIPEAKVNKTVYDIMNTEMEKDAQNNVVLAGSRLFCFGNEAEQQLKPFMQKGSTDIFGKGSESVLIVNNGMFYDIDKKHQVYIDVTTLKPGDEFELSVQTGQNQVNKVKVKVAGVLNQTIFGETKNNTGGIQIVAGEELFKKLAGEATFPEAFYIRLKQGADPVPLRNYLEDYTALNPDLTYLDYDLALQDYESSMLVLSIFIYGFIVVITLIGCVNIVNTISTNIILRRKELSMLRAIGATEQGIKKLVRLESILHGIVASIIGSVLGCMLSRLLYQTVTNVREFQWNLPLTQILIAVGGTLVVTILSGLIPLKRINNSVIIEGIRAEE
ncbi:MAG: FtsX-like permease family protein [Clostridia bacterium]|nr:FtsX-like permease family protein [Clostridia bacterium]